MRPRHILYVEDDQGVRDMMVALLLGEGFAVTAATTAEDALARLEERRFDLLLTDYRLPVANAAWLIDQACHGHHLDTTPVIVLTAELNPPGVAGRVILRKPVRLEHLLATFDEVCAAASAPAEVPAAATTEAAATADLVLALCAADSSTGSRRAMRNLERILEGVDRRRVRVVVHDIAGADERAWTETIEEDRTVVLPTLVRRHPLPRMWIAGDLSDTALVEEVVPESLQRTVSSR